MRFIIASIIASTTAIGAGVLLTIALIGLAMLVGAALGYKFGDDQ